MNVSGLIFLLLLPSKCGEGDVPSSLWTAELANYAALIEAGEYPPLGATSVIESSERVFFEALAHMRRFHPCGCNLMRIRQWTDPPGENLQEQGLFSALLRTTSGQVGLWSQIRHAQLLQMFIRGMHAHAAKGAKITGRPGDYGVVPLAFELRLESAYRRIALDLQMPLANWRRLRIPMMECECSDDVVSCVRQRLSRTRR